MKFSKGISKIFIVFLLLTVSLFSQERLVVLPGTIQGALGGKDWDPTDQVTKMLQIGEDQYEFTGIFPKGNYAYKVALDGTWSENYGVAGEPGGKDIKLVVPADNTKIKFTFDYKTKTITDTINGVSQVIVEATKPKVNEGEALEVRIPGTLQSVLGGKDWDPAGDNTLMTYVGNDIYEFSTVLPKGNYEFKIAIGGDWSENYGEKGQKDGSNIPFTVPADNTNVKFTFNYKTKEVKQDIAMEGFNIIPIITNKFEEKGNNKPVNITNELELGILSNNIKMKSKFNYNFDYDKETDKKFVDTDYNFGIKNLKIAELAVDYTYNNYTAGAMVNTSNFKNSNDYFGVLETSQENSKRKYGTIQIKEIAKNNYGLRFATDNFANISIEAAKYVKDIYEPSSTEKTLALINIEKNMFDNKLTLGSSNVFYQVSHDGNNEDLLINGTLYGKLDVTKNLQIKGEIGYIPTGSILETKANTGTFKQSNGKWKFVFDPTESKATKKTTSGVISEVHLVGEMNSWNAADKTYALQPQGDGTWAAEFTVADEKKFKFIYDSDSWNGNESPDDMYVRETPVKGEGLDHGINLYMAEVNYKLWNKGNLQFGTKVMNKGLYMPFAKDDLMYNNATGSSEYYLNTDYKITKNLKFFLEELYKTEENTDNMLSKKTKVGFDITNIPMVEYVKLSYEQDPYTMQDPSYNLTDRKDAFRTNIKDGFIEFKLNRLPIVKYLKINTTQRFESDAKQYYLETELKDYSKYVAYVKGNLTFADDKVHYSYQDNQALQYWAEIKLQNLPIVSYVTASYEIDDNGDKGIVEQRYYYNKDDNDWLEKIKLETKFEAKSLTKWDGLTASYETRRLESQKTNYVPSDLTKDEQYYVADERTFINWYSIITLSTGYNLPLDIKTKLTYKYDLAHKGYSEFEDDGIKVELEKKIGKTTISASYNTKDSDNGKNYAKVMFKTVF